MIGQIKSVVLSSVEPFACNKNKNINELQTV